MNATSAGDPEGREPRTLVGRELEQGMLAGLIQRARRRVSGAAVLVGDAGMGKTALLEYARTIDASVPVRAVTGVEAEQGFPFMGLQRLITPSPGELAALPGTQRAALATALGLDEREGTADIFLVGLAALTLLAARAHPDGLLCLVDDAQWLDPESLRVLAFVARRLEAEGVVIVFAARDSDDTLAQLANLPLSRLAGLRDGAALRLLTELAGPVDDTVAERIVADMQGCPLALVEAADALAGSDWAGPTSGADPLPLSSRIEARFSVLLRDLPADAQAFLLVVACEPSGDRELIRHATTALGIDAGGEAAAHASGLLASGGPLQFRHPLVRAAAYGIATDEDRRRAHRALASALDGEADESRAVQHLVAAAVGPDDDLGERLVRLARRASRRGAPSAESTLLVQAAELTSDPAVRTRRLLDAAWASLRGGRPSSAARLLDLVRTSQTTDPDVAEATQLAGQLALTSARAPEAAALLLEAARSFLPHDRSRARSALVDALEAQFAARSGSPDRVLHDIATLAVENPAAGPPALPDLILDGTAKVVLGDRHAGLVDLRRATSLMTEGRLTPTELTRFYTLGNYILFEQWNEAAFARWLDRVAATARHTGALVVLLFALTAQIDRWGREGNFAAAQRSYDEAVQLASSIGLHANIFSGMDALLRAWCGDVQEARASAAVLEGIGNAVGSGSAVFAAQGAVAVLEMSLGNAPAALAAARFILDRPSFGMEPQQLPIAVEAAVKAGDTAYTEAVVERLRRSAVAAGTPWALGMLSLCEALVASDADAEPLYAGAVERLERTSAMVDLAKAHLAYGEWLRRRRRRAEARIELRVAAESFAGMGAAVYAERARDELRAAGEAPRPQADRGEEVLSPQEYRVAERAARGATNVAIAGELYISPNTVDYHLRKVFRKLGITSRRELPGALGAITRPGRTGPPTSPAG